MSETMLVVLITAAILAGMFAWVPLLNLVCPPCGRALLRMRQTRVTASVDEANEVSVGAA